MIAVIQSDVFKVWFSQLRDLNAKARIEARISRARQGNLGDCEPVGGGVSEMRIHYGEGYRVYLASRGMEVIVLLAGGTKKTQSKDIQKAIAMAQQLKG